MPEIPRKAYYKPSEVCAFTDTQPYQLRFWESELPQLSAKEGVYRREDIDLILRIKQMLNEQDCSIGEVRTALELEAKGAAPRTGGTGAKASAAAAKTAPKTTAKAAPASQPAARATTKPAPTRVRGVLQFDEQAAANDMVPRSRYEDALDEVAHLRLELQEAEALRRKAENAAKKAREETQRLLDRSQTAIGNIEQLIRRLT